MVNSAVFYAAIMTLACNTSRLPKYFTCPWNCYIPCYNSSS